MPMTENELADLDKLLLRMDKNAKAWAWTRWLELVSGLMFLGGGAWILMQQPVFLPALLPKDLNSPVTAFDLWSARESAISYCIIWAGGVFQLYFGITLLIRSLCLWRKGRNDRLLVKMAQAWLESQQAVSPGEPKSAPVP